MTHEKKLKLAVKLLLLSLTLEVITATLPNVIIPGRLMVLFFVLAMTLVYGFIIWQIKLKQNWARILFVIIYAFALFGTASNLMMLFTNLPEALAFYNQSQGLMISINSLLVLERILEGTVICLLFSKDTTPLFKKLK